MANSKAAKKNILVSRKKHDRNQHFKTGLKTSLKLAHACITTINDGSQTQINATCKMIDRLVTKGILKEKNRGTKKV